MKKVTKMLAAALSCSMLLTSLPTSALTWVQPDDNTPTSGTCGDALTWKYDRESTVLTISGTGDMTDYSEEDMPPWWSWAPEITELDIADGVTSIGDYGIFGCDEIVSVTLPESVTSIGDKAFQSCWGMTEIHLPDTLTEIGAAAFASSGLTEFTVPAGVTEISEECFKACYNLLSVNIPETVTSISDEAFAWVGLTSVVIPESVTEIGENAFIYCTDLKEAEVHAKYIGSQSFCLCTSLERVELSGVERIGQLAFAYCNALEKVDIPISVGRIDGGAFANCESLALVQVFNPGCDFNEEDIPEEYDGKMTFCNGAEEVEEDVYVPYFNGVIYGYPGSTAQTYTETYGYTFKAFMPVTPGTPAEPLLGDVNGDGMVDAGDAADILVEAALNGAGESAFTDEQKALADVNGDGIVEAADSAIILQYAAAVGSGDKDAKLEDFV